MKMLVSDSRKSVYSFLQILAYKREMTQPSTRIQVRSSASRTALATQRPILLAVVGMSGTGKSEATAFLRKQFGLSAIYMGGIILDEVKKRGYPSTQEHERKVRENLRAKHGMNAVAKLALKSIRRAFGSARIVLLDGLYSKEELHYLRRFHEEFVTVVIAIHADKYLRYKRLESRPIRPLGHDQVDLRDVAELENLNKAEPIVLADHHICNNFTVRTFRKSLSTLMGSIESWFPLK